MKNIEKNCSEVERNETSTLNEYIEEITKFVKSVPVLLLPMIGSSACKDDIESEERDIPEEVIKEKTKKVINVDELSEFRTERILIFSECEKVRDYARDLIKTGRRYADFKVSKVDKSKYEGKYKGRDITVGCEKTDINGDYDIINVRGHIGDMDSLISDSQTYYNDHVTLILGGCNASSLIPKYAKDEVAVIGGSGIQDTANNNYLILQLPKVMEDSRSWAELDRRMGEKSSRWDSEFNNPGDYSVN